MKRERTQQKRTKQTLAIANYTSVHNVRQTTAENNQSVEYKMDIKIIENIKKDNLSEGTLRLTTRLKELAKPRDYRFTQGQWKKYAPSRA